MQSVSVLRHAALVGVLLASWGTCPLPVALAQPPVQPPATAKSKGEEELKAALEKLLDNKCITITVAAVSEGKYAVRLDGNLANQAEIDGVLALIKPLQPNPILALNPQLKVKSNGVSSPDELKQLLEGLLNGDPGNKGPVKVWVGQVDGQRYVVRLSGELDNQEALDGTIRAASALVPAPISVLNTSGLTVKKTPTKPATVEVVERWRMNFLPLGVKPLNPEDASPASSGPDTIDRLVTALNQIYGAPGKNVVERANYAELILRGGPATRLQIKKILAVVDVAWPQVQTNLWAIQVSGERREVGNRVRIIQADIRKTRLAVQDTLGILNRIINENASRFQAGPQKALLDRMTTLGFRGKETGPLSLNEMLIYLAIDPARQKGSQLTPLCDRFAAEIEKQPYYPASEKPQPGSEGRIAFPILRATFKGFPLGVENADMQGIVAFVTAVENFKKAGGLDNNGTPPLPNEQQAPIELGVAAATADRLLKGAVDAFSADVEALFFQPLLQRCQDLAGGGDGVALVGQTRIVVTSNIEARLTPSLSSYVETTRPRPFGKEILDMAFPQTRTASDAQTSSTNTTGGTTTANGVTTPTGPTTTASSERKVSDTSGVSGATGTSLLLSNLTPLQAVGLAAVLNDSVQPTFARVTPGIAVNIRPMVFPDGGAARMVIDARFGVRTTDIGDQSARKEVWVYPQPTAVESHQVSTDTAVSAFDLFDLSHISVTTSTPQPPEYIPVLGRLPILGPLFQRPRGNKEVHYESILLINSVILPRSLEMARFYSGN